MIANRPDCGPSDLKDVQRDEHYHSLAEALPLIVWTADRSGWIDWYNSRWYDYTGQTVEQAAGWGWQSAHHPEDFLEVMKRWPHSIATGEPFDMEFRLRGRDGAFRWFLTRVVPLRSEQGDIIRWYGSNTDIDEQRRAFDTQQQIAEQFQCVIEATDRLWNALDMHESLQTLCELLTPRFSDWSAVTLVEPNRRLNIAAIKHVDSTKSAVTSSLSGSLPSQVDQAIATVLSSRRPLVVRETDEQQLSAQAADENDPRTIAELGAISHLHVPLLVRGEVFGVLTAAWTSRDKHYSQPEVHFFEEVAKRAAIACDENVRHDRAHIDKEITQRVLQSSDDCIALIGLDGRLLKINECGSASFAASGHVLDIGSLWSSCWRHDDRPAVDLALSAARDGSSGRYQGRLGTSEAAPQWWDVALNPICNAGGRPLQLLAIARNVTLQKARERALEEHVSQSRAFANTIPHIAFAAGADGTLEFVNDRWHEYTGLSYEETLTHGANTVTHADDPRTLTPAWFTSTAADGLTTETRLRRASDGVYRWHAMRTAAVQGLDGKTLQWFGTATDIDDQKRAGVEIALARDEALAAARIKAQFVATMSHEIRTPMSGVIGMAELLLLTSLSSEQREYATVVRDSGQSLLRVINDILDYSKIEAGALRLESLAFNVASQIESVDHLLRPQFENKGITFTSNTDADVPDSVFGDPGRLRQVLINILGNACKFTPAGGKVEIRASGISHGPDGSTVVRFVVNDSGIGISPEAQQQLFEPFSQADGSTTRRYGGTGLGLSICKQLVTLMGGAIGVESVEGAGSSFWLSLPFQHGVEPRHEPIAPVNELGERRRIARTRSEKLLLVEDNTVNTLLAVRQLKMLGFHVATVTNGREAVEAVQSSHFDLVFMDCHMPDMDGFEATKAIRNLTSQATSHLPIVAMTADAQVEDRETCLAAGMDDYISKPASLEKLATMLERWLPDLIASPA